MSVSNPGCESKFQILIHCIHYSHLIRKSLERLRKKSNLDMTQAKVEKTMNVMPSLIDLSFQSPVMTQENRLDENLDLHFEETWNVTEMRDVEEAWDPASLLNLQLFLDAEDMYDVLDILESLELGEIVEV
jgi:hypothetical protein